MLPSALGVVACRSKLKSLPSDEYQGKLQPMRRLKASSLAKGARDTATTVTSCWRRCMAALSMWSARKEQPTQPSSQSGPNMKW